MLKIFIALTVGLSLAICVLTILFHRSNSTISRLKVEHTTEIEQLKLEHSTAISTTPITPVWKAVGTFGFANIGNRQAYTLYAPMSTASIVGMHNISFEDNDGNKYTDIKVNFDSNNVLIEFDPVPAGLIVSAAKLQTQEIFMLL